MGLNRWRRQLAGGTPLNTLRDGAEAEGAAVLSFLECKGQQVFEQHGFSAVGEPSAGCQAVSQAEAYQPQVQEARTVTSVLATVCQDMRQRGLAEVLVGEVQQQGLAAGYESAADTVTIHLDDVGVKEQKAQHGDPVTEPAVTLSDTPARTGTERSSAGFFAWHGAASLLLDWYPVVKFVTKNWRGRPLDSLATVVNFIA